MVSSTAKRPAKAAAKKMPAARPTTKAEPSKPEPSKAELKNAEPSKLEQIKPEQRQCASEQPAGSGSIRVVNGYAVVTDEPTPSPLPARPGHPPIVFHNLRTLKLEDGSMVFGCGECEVTGTRGEVLRHRHRDHGRFGVRVNSAGGKAKRPDAAVDPEVLALTVGEFFELAREASEWAEMFANVTAMTEEWKERALKAEAWKRKMVLRLSQVGFNHGEDD